SACVIFVLDSGSPGEGRSRTGPRQVIGRKETMRSRLAGRFFLLLSVLMLACALAPDAFAVPAARYDFDSSGKPDVVFRHAPSGSTYIWRMNGLALSSDQYVTAIDPSW